MPLSLRIDRLCTLKRLHHFLVGGVVYLVVCVSSAVVFVTSFGLVSPGSHMPDLFSAHDALGIAGIGVALSTSIGSHVSPSPSNSHHVSAVGVVSQIGNVGVNPDSFFHEHFSAIDSYANVLSTDVGQLLHQSDDRSRVLDVYIDELAYRRDDAVNRLVNIDTQYDVLSDKSGALQDQIGTLQQKIATGYDNRDETGIVHTLADIEVLRAELTDVQNQLLFLGRFRADYQALRDATGPYLKAIEANREALVADVTVRVLDDTTPTLERLNIISFGSDQ